MKLDRVPSRILLELGLVGAVATAEACTQVSTCLSMQGPTSGTGDTGDTMGSESATSTSGPTSTTDISTSACLSPPDPTLDDATGPGDSTAFTTGPCLSQPADSSDSGSGSESGSGSDSGSESDSDSGSDSGGVLPSPDSPDSVARRVLESGTLPADVAARLRDRRAGR